MSTKKNLDKARRILEATHGRPMSSDELAALYGYTPQDQRPEVIVSAATSQARIDELRAAGYNPITDDKLSRALGELPDVPRIETDPITGRQEYRGSAASLRPRGFAFAGTPPVLLEQPRIIQAFGRYPINRYSLRPGAEFVAQAIPGADLEAEPTFFSSGDLPPFTASGIDPQTLAWCSWEMRHSAAFSDSRSHVLEIVEASAEGVVEDTYQNEGGRAALNSYISRVQTWWNTIPNDQPDMPDDELAATWYPPGTET